MKYGVQDWEEVSREEVFKKFGRGIEKRVYRLPQGNEAEFYLKTGHSSICCLALTKENQVILAKQFRPGPSKILLEIPGGGMNDHESKEDAIARELLEETGYKGNIQFVVEVLPDAYSTYTKNFFVATECEKITESKLEDNGEEVEVVLMNLTDFRTHIRTGKMTDVEGAYLCLDYLQLL
ncbi:MAG: NUDIX hydrolase [Candidatus Moranbacteria bacterium]|nr:NUDIX hydrolase [Candidatus Moranbacteria bacterium]MDD3964509.1 NUDIX hydrolase [Candidatus Moranbacteria bacterium]